jgi:chromosome segregation ATPase
LSHFLSQEQDSPDSLFSFAIDISEDEGEEASSSRAVGIVSAEIRAKLEELSAILHQDTTQLVNDSDPAKVLFKTLRGQIPADAEETLFQAAHLESRQLQYQRATRRLADRAAQTQLSEEMMKEKLLADEKHKNIGTLKSSGDALKQKISDLSAKREALLAELKQVEDALSQAQPKENQLSETIKHLEQERNTHGRKALQLKKKLKPIEGSADEDVKEIEAADQIRLRAISAIQALLSM